MCPAECLTVHFSFTGEEKVLRTYIRWPYEETLQEGGAVLGCHPEPCSLVTRELEASLTLMDPVILSQCQDVLLHPVLVLTNYQACLTGEGCFNLVLWGLSLDDPGSTVPCVVSVSFQGGLCESAGASPPPFQARGVPPDHQENCRLDVWVLRTLGNNFVLYLALRSGTSWFSSPPDG